MDKPNVFTREQLKAAYDIFQDVSGGLESEWIFSDDAIEPERLRYMLGTPVAGYGAGRTWSAVWVNLKNMSLSQTEKWIQLKDSIEGVDATDTASNYITRLQFTPHADQLQELQPEVDADSPADTDQGV